ncbi:MAG TPA: hypothetical protein VKY74_21185 [Chloroflexia bacterium]|nr:hypothetical protein [Chloroflexia bacterium]
MTTNHLATLEEYGLIRLAQIVPDLAYLFRHALVQDAAYYSLLKADRKRLHGAVGEILEVLYPTRREELASLLAEHFAGAGDDRRALEYFTLAGDSAARKYANPEAAAHYSRALAITTRTGADSPTLIHLYAARGRALELSSRYAEALENYAAMEAAGQEHAAPALELAGLVAAAVVRCAPTAQQDRTAGAALCTRALALARALGDRAAESRILWAMMLLYGMTASAPLDQISAYGEESLRIARELGLREQIAQTLNDLSYNYGNAGREQEALAALAESQALWREQGNLPMLTDNLNATALRRQSRGEYRASFPLAEEAYRISETIGNRWGMAFSGWIQGMAYMNLGAAGPAIAFLEQAVRLGEQGGFVIAAGMGRVLLSWIYYDLGAYRPARSWAEAAIAFAESLGRRPRSQAYARLALAEAAAGDCAAAAAQFAQARQTLDRKDPLGYPIVAASECEYGLLRRAFAEVVAVADAFLEGPEFTAPRSFVPFILSYKGRALFGLGEVDAAEAVLAEARAAAEAQEARPVLWPTLIALAEIARGRGATAQAAALREQARAHLIYMADQIGDAGLRASFLGRPQVRAVLE